MTDQEAFDRLMTEKNNLAIELNLAKSQILSYQDKCSDMNQLYRLVVAMRKAQKAYFVTKQTEQLKAARQAENQLDSFLKHLQQVIHARQMNLL